MFQKKSQKVHTCKRFFSHRILVIMIVTVVMVHGILGQTAWAEETGNTAGDAGLGIASFVATLPYGALKLAYAGLGAIIGGFTYVLTGADLDSAKIVWEKSVLGTYVLTPEHLTGDKPIRFIGP